MREVIAYFQQYTTQSGKGVRVNLEGIRHREIALVLVVIEVCHPRECTWGETKCLSTLGWAILDDELACRLGNSWKLSLPHLLIICIEQRNVLVSADKTVLNNQWVGVRGQC